MFSQKYINIDKIGFDKIDIACYKKDSLNYLSAKKFLTDNEIKKKPKFLVSNFETMKSLCKSLDLVCIAPEVFVDKNEFVILETKKSLSPTTINICYPKKENLSKIANLFINFVSKV